MIQRFLKDIEDKHYDGVPLAGVNFVPLQNPAYRSRLQLPDNNLGARVDYLRPNSSASNVLQPEDVVLQIGEFPVASDGTILYQSNRVFCALGFQLGQSGDQVPVKIWRAGQAQTVTVKVAASAADQPEGNQFDVEPRYFVFGGLVFTPLSRDYLGAATRESSEASGTDLTYELFYRAREEPKLVREEPVVLSSVLPDAVNANFRVRSRVLVDRINGLRIEKISDVIRAFETSTNTYDVIEFIKSRQFECLDHAEALRAHDKILKTYGVPRDRQL